MLRLSRQKERETERRLMQREASARGRRPAVTRSFSTDDARPRLAAEQTPLSERRVDALPMYTGIAVRTRVHSEVNHGFRVFSRRRATYQLTLCRPRAL